MDKGAEPMKNYYYNIMDDIKAYPRAWCFIVVGGRNTGKTYGSLKGSYEEGIKHTFLKRTMEDVDLLCAGTGKIGAKQNAFGIDLSPYKSVNRDLNINVKAFSIKKGIGGFWKCDEEDAPIGHPIAYLLALSAVTKFKGFDLSDCEWLIFDEFVPQPWERVNKKEGEQLLDLYQTIQRDREHRGKDPLKLLCFANATEVSSPVTNIFELTDIMVEMQAKDQAVYYDEERGILLRILKDNKEFMEKTKQTQIYKAMGNTAWGKMAFENEFAYNDFTSVGKLNMKGFKPIVSIKYKHNVYYIWMKDGQYYMCSSRNDKCRCYDLNTENGQKAFYIDYVIDLRNECIDGKMIFEKYTMYDILINYRKFFKV